MSRSISLLIPYEPDNGPRDQAFQWILAFYHKYLPEAQICIGRSRSSLFSRAQAVNDAARKATRPIYFIIDADLVFDPSIAASAEKLLNKHPWVIPYDNVCYLSRTASERVRSREPVLPHPGHGDCERIKQPAPRTPCVGGFNIVPRKHFERIHGFDERFIGWGGEDRAFMSAMNTLCGPYKRMKKTLYHLWHPHVGGKRNPNYKNNKKRRDLYLQAEGDKKRIQHLISRNRKEGQK
ncbi:galactosyltransferase-related protein [Salibacterium sp. K-3]